LNIDHSKDVASIGLTLTDYLNGPNANLFNTEMKQLSNGNYIESSNYTYKKENKNQMNDNYNQYKQAVATVAFAQDSVRKGSFIMEFILFQTFFSSCECFEK
jgi:hypothetical protein